MDGNIIWAALRGFSRRFLSDKIGTYKMEVEKCFIGNKCRCS